MLRYGTKVRSQACRRMLAGERVEAMAGELEVSRATLYRCKRQALVDAGDGGIGRGHGALRG